MHPAKLVRAVLTVGLSRDPPDTPGQPVTPRLKLVVRCTQVAQLAMADGATIDDSKPYAELWCADLPSHSCIAPRLLSSCRPMDLQHSTAA